MSVLYSFPLATSFKMLPSIFKASIENFCCSLLLSLLASAIRSIKASSLSCALSLNDNTVGSSASLAFFLAAFFTSFQLFGVLVHFPFLPLFLKNKDFANVNDSSPSESDVNTSPDGPRRSSDWTSFLF